TPPAPHPPPDPPAGARERPPRLFTDPETTEIYTPAAKRRFGYYSLPVLVDDAIVARVDLKADRPAGIMRVQSAWWEPGAASPATADRIAAELRTAARWQGLGDITVAGWGDAVGDLAAHGPFPSVR
ncbi:MAG: winged helix DNA-binding domain-containing protein, partial [Actinomycetes bacterium]|nr:winged helix DNA-binding domain-containing protein [Actinomycetes bacterium]MDX5380007.1 winged helix DNA-binding domain-containing protein [Actinomycetes bacterium]MDX5398549.1 winged helix DNA-binding domain-containing protein [Actinomycetes bacterium]MDX5449703.1 winged helix DNA-binding domain-containing protein [Actinomycetes bacterium]